MSKNNLPKGKIGEQLACKYLQKKGYHIVIRNFHTRWDELDIIATYRNKLVFVEVKTRWSKKFGSPEAAVNSYKLNRIKRAAQFFSLKHPKLPQTLQIDVIAVDMSRHGQLFHLEHFKNVTS